MYERLCSKLDREPTIKEVAEVLKVPSSKLYMVIISNASNVSLDEPIDSDTPSSISEFLADDSIDIENDYELKESFNAVKDTLNNNYLTLKEKEVLNLLYGLDGNNFNFNRVRVAKMLGISPQRVAMIEKRALEKIKDYGINGLEVSKKMIAHVRRINGKN